MTLISAEPKHFIRDLESHRHGAFTIYMALVGAAGDLGRLPVGMNEVSIKWLRDETRMTWTTIATCLRFFHDKGILKTEERLDTLYYEFSASSHAEVADKVRQIIVTVRPSTHDIRNRGMKILKKLIRSSKTKQINMGYCLGKIKQRLAEFHKMKLAEAEVDNYFESMNQRVAQGEHLESILCPAGQKPPTDENLTRKPIKVIGWAD